MDAENGNPQDMDLLMAEDMDLLMAEEVAEIHWSQAGLMAILRKSQLPAVGLLNRWRLPAVAKRKGLVEQRYRRLAAAITRFGKLQRQVVTNLGRMVELEIQRVEYNKKLDIERGTLDIERMLKFSKSIANRSPDNTYNPNEDPRMRRDLDLLAKQMAALRKSHAEIMAVLPNCNFGMMSVIPKYNRRSKLMQARWRRLAEAITRYERICEKLKESRQWVMAELKKQKRDVVKGLKLQRVKVCLEVLHRMEGYRDMESQEEAVGQQ